MHVRSIADTRKGCGIAGRAETVGGGDLHDALPGLDQSVHGEDGRVRRQDELILTGSGFGVQIVNTNTDALQGQNDFRHEWECCDVLLVGKRAPGSGGVERSEEVAFCRGIALAEGDLNLEPNQKVDIVFSLKGSDEVLQGRSWAHLQRQSIRVRETGHDSCGILLSSKSLHWSQSLKIGFDEDGTDGVADGSGAIVLERSKIAVRNAQSLPGLEESFKRRRGYTAHAHLPKEIQPLHKEELSAGKSCEEWVVATGNVVWIMGHSGGMVR